MEHLVFRASREVRQCRLIALFTTLLPSDLGPDIAFQFFQLGCLCHQSRELVLHERNALFTGKVAAASCLSQFQDFAKREAKRLSDADDIG